MKLLAIRSLSRRFGQVEAVRDVSLAIDPGEIVALVGPNGAGKSTVLKTIVGLIRPTAGEVEVGGESVTGDPVRARKLVGYVPQRVQFGEGQRTEAVVAYYAALKGLASVDPARVLASVGLAHAASRQAHQLSGGMMQRLGLGIALLGSPPLLVLDEPMVSLDPDGSDIVRRTLAHQRDRGGSVLLATHLLSDAELLADRVCMMAHGRVLADDSVPQLVRRFAPALEPRLEAWSPEPGVLETVYRAAMRSAGVTE